MRSNDLSGNCDFELKNGSGFCFQGFIGPIKAHPGQRSEKGSGGVFCVGRNPDSDYNASNYSSG
jgi:hypothetical protein